MLSRHIFQNCPYQFDIQYQKLCPNDLHKKKKKMLQSTIAYGIIAKFHMTDLIICIHFRERKNPVSKLNKYGNVPPYTKGSSKSSE